MISCEAWDPLVEDEGVDCSPDGPGRSSENGKDPRPLLVTDKSAPGTLLSCTSLSCITTMTYYGNT